MPPQPGSPRSFPPLQQRFPILRASSCSRGTLYWDTAQTTRSLCNWLSLQVPFWLSVWKQNSVAKHYLFFMSLLLLCQGSGINFGCFIKKFPVVFPSCSLESSKTNNETIRTEERNKVWGFFITYKIYFSAVSACSHPCQKENIWIYFMETNYWASVATSRSWTA